MMFPMVLPAPRTSASFGAGFPPCFLWQTASASMPIGASAGAFPSNVTVPVTDEAATATPDENHTATPTPDQNHTATAPAASHNVFLVTRLLSPFVIAELLSVVGDLPFARTF